MRNLALRRDIVFVERPGSQEVKEKSAQMLLVRPLRVVE